MTNTMRRRVASGLLAAGMLAGPLANGAEASGAVAPYPELSELNWEKRSDWIDVTQDVTPAAVGDGVADDTAALQAAFDRVHGEGRAFSTVYLPPGTYRITAEIHPKRPDGARGYLSMHLRGHGRSTRIVWDGSEGGTMLRIAGFSYSSFIGTVWDGRGKAARGFVHDGGNDTKVLHEHQAFMNFTEQGSGTTEPPRAAPGYLEGSTWRNCLFINCGKGLAFWQANDYVFTIDGCEFHDNDYGIWSERGNFYARNCHFQRSRQADIVNANDTHGSSARRCTSVGSRAFYERGGSWGTIFTMQDCHISGWTHPDYAVRSRERAQSPMLIFDCTFTDAPSTNPLIRLEGPTPVVHANNRWSTGGALAGGRTEHVQEVPPGERTGSIASARQRFFRSDATIPTKVFDAKRDFGAAADGRSDDTDAVQGAIDAARQHGQGAIAYLPRGRYYLSRTVNITGGDYYVGGAGGSYGATDIMWSGDDRGPIFLVADPQNVTLKNFGIWINHRFPTLVSIRQVSTNRQPSRMHYDHLFIASTRRGLPANTEDGCIEVMGLPNDSVLTANDVRAGRWLFDNCSSARILISGDGLIWVRGKQSDRGGFMGVMTSQAQFLIEDNQSLVGSDCYQEQMGHSGIGRNFPYAVLRGSPTLPAGRVTLSAPKMCGHDHDVARTGESFEEYFTVDSYRGRLASVITSYNNPSPTYDPNKRAFKIVCSGEAPLDVLLMANAYGGGAQRGEAHRTKPVIEGGANVTRTVLGCWLSHPGGEPLPNVLHDHSLRLAAQALDDFRELGEHDLELNHGIIGQGQGLPQTQE